MKDGASSGAPSPSPSDRRAVGGLELDDAVRAVREVRAAERAVEVLRVAAEIDVVGLDWALPAGRGGVALHGAALAGDGRRGLERGDREILQLQLLHDLSLRVGGCRRAVDGDETRRRRPVRAPE